MGILTRLLFFSEGSDPGGRGVGPRWSDAGFNPGLRTPTQTGVRLRCTDLVDRLFSNSVHRFRLGWCQVTQGLVEAMLIVIHVDVLADG